MSLSAIWDTQMLSVLTQLDKLYFTDYCPAHFLTEQYLPLAAN